MFKRIAVFGLSAVLVVGCGTSQGPETSNPLPVDDILPIDLPPVDVPPVVVPRQAYATDARDTDLGDPGSDINPILSIAPPDCNVGADAADPACDNVRGANFNAVGQDTWIDAQVFVPEHTEGQTFPLILHSHGWGGSKKETVAEPDCVQTTAPYNCPDQAGEGLFGFFGQVDGLLDEFAHGGYIVISFSERGWGNSEGDIMVMNPYHETQDAIAVLDWAAQQAQLGTLPITIDETGDMPVGMIGGSYGGGFQFLLAQVDDRIDASVPTGTWHSLTQSIIPNGVVKGGFGNLLCLLSAQQTRHDLLGEACTNMLVSVNGLASLSVGARTAADLDPNGTIIPFIRQNGMQYMDELAANSTPFRENDAAFALRPVPTLLIQGQRDALFPLQEAIDNYQTLQAAGGDTRLLSNQGGHMNPLANQVEGTPHCGSVSTLESARAWMDVYVRGADANNLNFIPEVCLSLQGGVDGSEDLGVILNGIPGRDGAINAELLIDTAPRAFSVSAGGINGGSNCETVFTVPDDGADYVLAGAPQLTNFTVSNGVAYLGVCVDRAGTVQLVDEMVSGFPTSAVAASTELVGVAERLLPGDQVGVMAFNTHVQFTFLGGATAGDVSQLAGSAVADQIPGLGDALGPVVTAVSDGLLGPLLSITDTNSFTAAGDIVLPIFPVSETDLACNSAPCLGVGVGL